MLASEAPVIPLIPKVLFLHDGPMKELGRLFQRNFGQVWRRLNPKTQKTIAEYFRTHRGTVYLCYAMDADNQEPYGRCAYDVGRTAVTFSAPFFALADRDELRVAVIAHELAHIYRRGSGEWTANNEAEELATRALALQWGYHAPSMRDEAHKAELDAVENEWRAENLSYRNEFESRWLGRWV